MKVSQTFNNTLDHELDSRSTKSKGYLRNESYETGSSTVVLLEKGDFDAFNHLPREKDRVIVL